MNNNESTSLFWQTVFYSLVAAWATHLFLPVLLAISVGFIVGYKLLQDGNVYGSNYNLFGLSVFGIGIASPLFPELSQTQARVFIYMALILLIIKLAFQFTGFSFKRQFTNPQTDAMWAAVESKSILGVLVSLLNVQNIAVFAFLGLAIFPLLIIDLLIYWLFGVSTNRIFIFFGVLSLGMIAIVLDINDMAKIKLRRIKAKYSSEPENPESTPEEFANEIYRGIDSELPSIENVTLTRKQIRELDDEEFYQNCMDLCKQEANEEDIYSERLEAPRPFGYCYLFHDKVNGPPYLEFGLKIQEKETYSYEELAGVIDEYLIEQELEPTFVVITTDGDVEDTDKIRIFREYGLLIFDIDLLRRAFHEYEPIDRGPKKAVYRVSDQAE